MTQLGKVPVYSEFMQNVLLSSKQLYPGLDTTRQLLSMYYENHKSELDPNLADLYIDALSCNSDKLLTLNFSFYEISPRQVKFLSIVLPYCTEIQKLDLTSSSLGDVGIKYITKAFPRIETLEHLDIKNNHIGVQGFSYFAKGVKLLKNLKILDVSENIFDKECLTIFMEALETSTSLQKLCMDKSNIDNDSICLIIKTLAKLKLSSLSLRDNLFSDSGLEEIILMKYLNLENLDMSGSQLSEDSRKSITNEFKMILL